MSTTSTIPTGNSQPATKKAHFSGFQVPYILSWKNPYETGTLLAETLGIFAVFSSTLSLRVFLKLASTIIGLFSIVEWGSRAISGQRQGLILNYKPSRFLPLSDSVVNDVANYVSYAFRRVIFGIEHLVDARKPVCGLQLAAGLYVAYFFLGIFSLKTLVLASIIIAFGLPPLYLEYKTEVDDAINEYHAKAHQQAKVLGDKIYEKVGPQIEQVRKIVGPRGGFPGSANVSPIRDVPTAAAKPTAYTSTASTSQSSAAPTHSSKSETSGPTHYAATPSTGSVPVTYESITTSSPNSTTTTTTAHSTSAADAADVLKTYDSVPTLVGTVPVDQKKVNAILAEKAKDEGAVNGL